MEKKLNDFLEQNLTKREYDNLHDSLGMTKTKLSRLLSNSDVWTLDELEKLLFVLCSRNALVTLSEVTDFLNEYSLLDYLTRLQIEEINLFSTKLNIEKI